MGRGAAGGGVVDPGVSPETAVAVAVVAGRERGAVAVISGHLKRLKCYKYR